MSNYLDLFKKSFHSDGNINLKNNKKMKAKKRLRERKKIEREKGGGISMLELPCRKTIKI